MHEPGQLAHAHSYTMSVEQVEECPGQPPLGPAVGARRLGVEVVIEGTTRAEVPVNPFYAVLRDRSGNEYPSTLAGCESPLTPVRLSAEQKARGWISFDVPRSARELELSYSPVVIGVGSDTVRFKLQP